MKTLRIAQAALATILAVGINSTSYAFMAVDQPSQVQVDLSQMVDSLRDEIAAGETSCEDMLAKLDAVLEDIDAKLDAGVANEADYLAARDAVAEMRYNLECVANKLTHIVVDENGVEIPHTHEYADGMDGMGSGTDLGGGSNGGGNSGGGGGSSVGGDGGSIGGGGGAGGLATLAVIGGTVAAVTNNDNNFPGFPASPSGTN